MSVNVLKPGGKLIGIATLALLWLGRGVLLLQCSRPTARGPHVVHDAYEWPTASAPPIERLKPVKDPERIAELRAVGRSGQTEEQIKTSRRASEKTSCTAWCSPSRA